ncbi:tandem-95 repeat protein, partial [Modicisalibacter coralii]|uniref:tandem-95 repeat protein n=1 Tax=Modicisalibacter coralii TaxID=2304602 RepID=UPI00100BAF2E
PNAANDALTTAEDTALTIDPATLLANDSDVDGDTLTITSVSGAEHGSVVLNADGSITFTPAADYNGAASFDYTVSDGQGGSATATVGVRVTPVNDDPSAGDDNADPNAANDALTTAEDTALTIDPATLLANDSDVDGDTLTITSVSGAEHGSVVLNADGSITFTPAADYNGAASFDYTVSDGQGGSATATVGVRVTPVNDDPVANDDSYTTHGKLGGLYSEYFAYQEGADADGPNLASVSQVQAFIAEKGTPDATFVASSLFYNYITGNLANPDNLKTFLGADADSLSTQMPTTGTDAILRMQGVVELQAGSYTFKILSDDGYQVSIDGKPVATVDHNQSPATNEHSFTVAQGGTHAIEIVYWDQAERAIFQPELKFGDGDYSPLGDFVVDSPLTTAEDTSIYLRTDDLLANDTDADGDTLTVTSVGNASHGSVVLNADGTIVFTPATDYNGPATFEYTISDGQGGSDTATVTLFVTPVNDAPVANPDSAGVSAAPDIVYLATAQGTLEAWNLTTGGQSSVTIKDAAGNEVTYLGDISPSATSGMLYGVAFAGTTLYSIDAETGMATAVGAVSGLNGINALGLMPDGNLIAASASTKGLFSIDPTTLVATKIASTGFTSGGDLQYVGNHLYVADSDERVLEVALNDDGSIRTDATGNATTTVVATMNAPVYGLAENAQGELLIITTDNLATPMNVDTQTLGTPTTLAVPSGETIYGSASIVDPGSTLASGNLLTNDSDPEGDPLTVTSVANTQAGTQSSVASGASATLQGVYGTLTLEADGSYHYVLDANRAATRALSEDEQGSDQFTYTISDGQDGTASSTLTVTVTGINDAPSAQPAGVTGQEDTAITLAWSDLGVTDVDSSDAALGIVVTGLPDSGQLQHQNADGQWVAVSVDDAFTKADVDAGLLRFMPASNESGFDGYGGNGFGDQQADYAHLSFRPTDASGMGDESTLTIDVTPVADAPEVSISVGDLVSSERGTRLTVEDSSVTITVDAGTISAQGLSGRVFEPPFSNGNLNPGSAGNSQNADVIVLSGDFNKLVNGNQPVNSIDGQDKDYLYLSKSYASYGVALGELHQNSGYDGRITDLDTGVTITLNNIRGLIFGDGVTMMPPEVSTTITPTGHDIVALDLSAALVDVDGSEVLTGITLSGIPEGVKILGDGVTALDNGDWYVENSQGTSLDDLDLTMKIPLDSGSFDIQASVESREIVDGAIVDSASAVDSASVEQYAVTMGTPVDDTIEGTNASDIIVGDATGLQLVPGANYNVAFIVDTSGSVSQSDVNSAKNSLTHMFDSLSHIVSKEGAGNVNVFLLDFDRQAGRNVSVDLSDPDALVRLKSVLDSMQSGGGTNYEDAFKTTANWFYSDLVTSNPGTNLTYFITDGLPTYHQSDEAKSAVVGTYGGQTWTFDAEDYQPGQNHYMNIAGEDRLVVDSSGNVHQWGYHSGGCSSGWYDEVIGQVQDDGRGGHEISLLDGDGQSTPSSLVNDSLEAFALLEDVSTVDSIGLGDSLQESQLSRFDSDGTVQTSISPESLADAILGKNVELPAGDDVVDGGGGNDIIFGDKLDFDGVEGNGLTALKSYVAGRLGVEDPDSLSTEALKGFIVNHHAEFNQLDPSGGDDILRGGAGDDILYGQGGDDLLQGGSGDDILYGGMGADTFKWSLGDQGASGSAAQDTVMSFNTAEGDTLDLSELLQDRSDSLDAYLRASDDGEGGTVLHVSTSGSFGDGSSLDVADQTIHMQGMNYSSDIVQQMLDSGQLMLDQ